MIWRVLATAVILAALVWRFGAGTVVDGIRAVTPGAALAALGIGVVTTVVCALRWRLVAHRMGLPLRLPTAVADYYGSLAVNAVLPAGVLGDVHRAVSHGSRVGALGRGVRAVVWERGIGQAVLVAVAAAVVLAHPVRAGGGALVVVAGALVAGGALVVVLLRGRRWVRVLAGDARALGRGGLAGSAALSLVAVAGCVGLFLVAARTAGVVAAAGDLVLLAATALLVMAVPLSVGGWGPREAYLAAAVGVLGLDPVDGFRTSVIYGVLALASAAPGFLVLFGRLVVQRRQVRAERGDQVGEDGLALAGAAQ